MAEMEGVITAELAKEWFGDQFTKLFSLKWLQKREMYHKDANAAMEKKVHKKQTFQYIVLKEYMKKRSSDKEILKDWVNSQSTPMRTREFPAERLFLFKLLMDSEHTLYLNDQTQYYAVFIFNELHTGKTIAQYMSMLKNTTKKVEYDKETDSFLINDQERVRLEDVATQKANRKRQLVASPSGEFATRKPKKRKKRSATTSSEEDDELSILSGSALGDEFDPIEVALVERNDTSAKNQDDLDGFQDIDFPLKKTDKSAKKRDPLEKIQDGLDGFQDIDFPSKKDDKSARKANSPWKTQTQEYENGVTSAGPEEKFDEFVTPVKKVDSLKSKVIKLKKECALLWEECNSNREKNLVLCEDLAKTKAELAEFRDKFATTNDELARVHEKLAVLKRNQDKVIKVVQESFI